MKKFIYILLCVLALSLPLSAQSTTTVTATHVADASGAAIPSGLLCFEPVDATGAVTGFRVGSIQVVAQERCFLVSNGSIGTGNTLVSTPTSLYYHIRVRSRQQTVIRDFGLTGITGSSWTLDTFDPNYSVVPVATLSVGTVTTLAPGTPATAALRSGGGGGAYLMDVGIPQGTPGVNCSSGSLFECDMTVPVVSPGVKTGKLDGIYMVDGTQYSTVYSAVDACIADTTVSSCVIDARMSCILVGSSADVIHGFDPYNDNPTHPKRVMLLLGPCSDYTLQQGSTNGTIVLRTGMNIIGTGGGATSSVWATKVSCNGDTTSVAGACLQLPTSGDTDVHSVDVEKVAFYGASFNSTGNPQICLNFDISSAPGGSRLEKSRFFQLACRGFYGDDMRLWGSPSSNTAEIQFNKFDELTLLRDVHGADYALDIQGGVANNEFYGGEIGTASGSSFACDTSGPHGATDIFIGGSTTPATMNFTSYSVLDGVATVTYTGATTKPISANTVTLAGFTGVRASDFNGTSVKILASGLTQTLDSGTNTYYGTFTFYTNAVDTATTTDSGTGTTYANLNPYSNAFYRTTIQYGGQLIVLGGAERTMFHATHSEGLSTCPATTQGVKLIPGGSGNVANTFDGGSMNTYIGGGGNPTGVLFDSSLSNNSNALTVTHFRYVCPTYAVLAPVVSGQINNQVINWRDNYGSTTCANPPLFVGVVPSVTSNANMPGLNGPVYNVTGTAQVCSIAQWRAPGERLELHSQSSSGFTLGGCTAPTVTVTTGAALVTSGGSATLTVTAANATTVTIAGSDGSNYTLSSTGGTRTVNPTATTTYIATATSSQGSVTATVVVNVGTGITTTGTLTTAAASVRGGNSTTLTAAASNATSVSIAGSDGSSYTLTSTGGTQLISPTTTTVYTLTATGGTGTVTASVTVNVNQLGNINAGDYTGGLLLKTGEVAVLGNNGLGAWDIVSGPAKWSNVTPSGTPSTSQTCLATSGTACTWGYTPFSMRSICTGTMTSTSTIWFNGLGSSTSTCTTTGSSKQTGMIMPHAGTATSLSVYCGSAGLHSDSGVVTVYKALATSGGLNAQTMTCTVGTGNTCTDSAHSFNYNATDIIGVSLQASATGTETLGNCTVAIQ